MRIGKVRPEDGTGQKLNAKRENNRYYRAGNSIGQNGTKARIRQKDADKKFADLLTGINGPLIST